MSIKTILSLLAICFISSMGKAQSNWEQNYTQGVNYFTNFNYIEAEKSFEKALAFAKEEFEPQAEEPIVTRFYYALSLFQGDKAQKALEQFELTLSEAQRLGTRDFEVERTLKQSIANCYSSLGQYNTAISKQKELINDLVNQGLTNTEFYAICLANLGDMYFFTGNYIEAKPVFTQAIAALEALGLDNAFVLAKAYNGMGLCHFSFGDYTAADKAYYQALEVLEKNEQENLLFYSGLYSNIATLSHVQGDYANAKKLHLESLMILQELHLENSMEYAEGLFTYATLLKDLGEYDNALTFTLQSQEIYSQFLSSEHLKFANLKVVLAEIHLKNGNYKEALKLNEEAAETFKTQAPKTNPGYGYALNGLANIYQVLGDSQKALDYYLMAEAELKRTLSEKHKDYGITIMNIATAYSALGEPLKSFEYFERATDIIAEAIGTQNTTYGELCILLLNVVYNYLPDNFLEFEYLIDTALKIVEGNTKKDGFFYNQALFYKAMAESKKGNLQQSIDILLNAEKNIAKNISGDNYAYSLVIYHLGMNYLLLNDYNNALTYFKKYNDDAISNISSVFAFRNHQDKQKYLNNIEHWFSDFTAIALDNKFESDEIKSITLNNQLLLKGLLLNSSKDILTELEALNDQTITSKIEHYRALKNVLDQQKFNLQAQQNDKPQEAFNQLETELVELYSAKFNTSLNFQRDWKEVQKKLSNNEVAIEFVRYAVNRNAKYAAYLIKSGTNYPIVVKLCDETTLSKLIEKKSPNALYASRGSQAKAVAVGTDLYNLIWKPLESHLNGIETVYFSPVGMLNQIPFTALPDENEVILLETYHLEQLSSTYLLTQHQTESKLSSNLFIGGVKYDNESETNASEKGTQGTASSWNYLSGTLTEVQGIEQVLRENQITTKAWIGDQATEQAFKALTVQSPSVIHIATHGFFFENPKQEASNFNPDLTQNSVYKLSEDPLMRSGLILAGANESWKAGSNISTGEDGILTALEISNLDLNKTDLIVLSACETGLGDINGSEGVFGLQRAFKMAGVKSIIMSLWEVPDAETAEFMNSFYKNWIALGNTKEAFRNTQLDMSSKYKSEPEKWAAFVLFE